MKFNLLLFFAVLFSLPMSAQDHNERYEREWKRADSLLQKGLPESAAKIVSAVYEKAKQKDQQVQMMKAEIYLIGADFQRNEEAFKDAISKASDHAAKEKFPNNAIWQSIEAQLYWNYYQQNRWQILDRTRVSNSTEIADFEQWDTDRFVQKSSALYLASLSRAEDLRQINIDAYEPILYKGVNTKNLRPTLFDLLAFRALEFFESDEKDLTKPAFAFTLSDPEIFAPAHEFVQHRFLTKDSVSLQWHALQLYQDLLRLHQNDAQKDALIDADLFRLKFAYDHSVLPDKKKRYSDALQQLKEKYNHHPLSALAACRKVALMMPEMQPYTGKPQPGNKEANYPEIVAQLQAIIRQYPESEGGILAKQLLQTIQSKSLSLTAEEVVLPDEPSKVLVSYKNISKAWFRIVRLNNADNRYIGSYRGYTRDFDAELLKMPALISFSSELPGAEDFAEHSTEVKLDELKAGTYAILISADQKFSKENNAISYALLQVSSISAINAGDKGFALHRKSGIPLSKATVIFFRQRYNDNIRGYDLVQTSTKKTDQQGQFTYPKDEEQSSALKIISGEDTVMLTGYFNGQEAGVEDEPQTRTFFFTDRSIYRPGQTIHFKAIMLRAENGGKKNTVIANENTEVTFFDANGQKIDSKHFLSNEFGSISGIFTAPQGLLTGNMRIANSSGSTYISVEEYKRPKFYVAFDTLKDAYALNDMISVQGKATAYAGNVVDGATVKYRVVRNARFPYWWCAWRWGFPQSPEMEIAEGTVSTDNKGNFKINFKAIPDASVAAASLPVFTYTITADVTDINGETRTGSSVVSVGYTSLQLSVDVPERAKAAELDTLRISSRNLNDQFVATTVSLTVRKLEDPSGVLRKRLWQMPDQFVMDSLTFKKYFPNDVYRNENEPANMSVKATLFQKNLTTTADGIVALPESVWKENGWYAVEIEATDKNGKKITEKKFVQLYGARQGGKTPEALVVLPQSLTLQPGEEAKVLALSGYEQLHLIRQEVMMDASRETKQLDLRNGSETWTKTLREEDRGGMMLQYATVKENRYYQEQVRINVPWSNKDLDISWETHRDKLQPGEKETWTMVVRGNKKEKLAAEMVATLYDASLDAFKPHQWNIGNLFPVLSYWEHWNGLGFQTGKSGTIRGFANSQLPQYQKEYTHFVFTGFPNLFFYNSYNGDDVILRKYKAPLLANGVLSEEMTTAESIADVPTARLKSFDEAQSVSASYALSKKPDQTTPQQSIPPRKNLQETAFFFPQLKTDAEGNIRLEFTMPEALTEWRLMAFAHTKELSTGILEGKIKTQKDLMVMPNLPRFMRQGDEIELSAKISNLSDKELSGNAMIELLDAATMQPLLLPFRISNNTRNFSVSKEQSTSVNWKLHVPESLYNPVVVRITARSGNFTDGEENTLPVVTNRMLVTETLPLWMNGYGNKTFSFDKLKHADSSKSLVHQSLTLEYTANPAWYAVQSLPYLMEYPYECAEQTFNRFYANALAEHIISQAPKVKAIFEKWRMESAVSSFRSPLEMNEELKSALLEETPWVLQAKTEKEQRENIAKLFDSYKLSRELNASLKKLRDMQLPEGGFSWFKGMRSDRFITQYIITGLGRLQHLGVKLNSDARQIAQQALPYLDREMQHDYDEMVRNKVKLDQQHIGYSEIQYLYMRSFFRETKKEISDKAFSFYKTQAAAYWSAFNPYMKGMIALALHRLDDKQTPGNIIQSLRETAIHKEELGMYWMKNGNSYWWYDAAIEAQSLLIECFGEVAQDKAAVDEMKRWLLKNKQTNSWETTKATADACYALLLSGTDWLEHQPKVSLQLGDNLYSNQGDQTEAGTGYFKVRLAATEVNSSLGDITVTTEPTHKNSSSTLPSWGAVYWQYFEDMDKISSAKTPLEIRKQLFAERNTDRGPQLQPITATQPLSVGDKLVVRIEIVVDRDMEYVHLKDMRAAAFEPINVLSGYKWQGGLGYYESTKDLSTNFFFDRLPKGKYVFEYPVFVQQKGSFSNGIATIQCMYAPEFSSHSEGVRVKVE